MKKLLIAGGAAMALGLAGVVAVAAGWYFLIRENAALASDPPEIPAALLNVTTSPTTAASTTGLTAPTAPTTAATLADQTQSDHSEAAHFVAADLPSVGIHSTARGPTDEVSGTV